MPSRRAFLAGTGIVAGAGCIGVRADAARRRDRVAAAVASSPTTPDAVTVTDDHLESAVAAFEAAKQRLEAEGGRPGDHGHGPGDAPPHADAVTRWDGVESLRRATWTLERHVGRRRAQGGMTERDVRDRLDEAEATVDPVAVDYTGGSLEACLVQSAVADERLAEARRSLERGREQVDDGGLSARYGAYALAKVAALYAEDADELQAPLSGESDRVDGLGAVYEATGGPIEPSGFELHAGLRWMDLTGSTPRGLASLADQEYDDDRLASAALAGVRSRHHEAAQHHFVETVESVPTTLKGVLEARKRAVAALDGAPTDGPLERRLVVDALDPLLRADGRLRSRTDRHDRFYRGLGDEDYRRERACEYLAAAALVDRVPAVVTAVGDTA